MMAKISSIIKKENYKVEIASPTGNILIADEPMDMGGKDLDFSPKELLASALAACTSATLKVYADRKGWDLDEVQLKIDLERDNDENITTINRMIILVGNLNETQKSRLLAVGNACPVHKILSNPIEISTEVK